MPGPGPPVGPGLDVLAYCVNYYVNTETFFVCLFQFMCIYVKRDPTTSSNCINDGGTTLD